MEFEEDKIEDELYSGAMSLIEILGWVIFVISLILFLLVVKLSAPLNILAWVTLVIGPVIAACGANRRFKKIIAKGEKYAEINRD